jgi:hypothetical protein
LVEGVYESEESKELEKGVGGWGGGVVLIYEKGRRKEEMEGEFVNRRIKREGLGDVKREGGGIIEIRRNGDGGGKKNMGLSEE